MIKPSQKYLLLSIWMVTTSLLVTAQDYKATRINNRLPIITDKHFTDLRATSDEGENINGPSLIRLPDWVPLDKRVDPSAVYYLYFAHHQGNYIRLAWASKLEGPWKLHKTGADINVGNRGVLDLGVDDRIELENGRVIKDHIASPDVLVDHENQRIIMYFHARTINPGGQRTFVSFSNYGLSFLEHIQAVVLGGSYFKVFEYRGIMYAVDNRADIYKGGSVEDPWKIPAGFNYEDMLWLEQEDDAFQSDIDADSKLAGKDIEIRHVGVHVSEDTLYVFYSRIGDAPERIMLSTIRLDNRTFEEWDPSYPPKDILKPDREWEGSNLPNLPSDGGSTKKEVNQVRDPDVFENSDGSLYLLYTGAGEFGIGLARLEKKTETVRVLKPEIKALMDPLQGGLMLKIVAYKNVEYTIRIFSLDGKLVDVINGRCQADGKAYHKWKPQALNQGIYIANLITKNHSTSVKFSFQFR